MKDPPELVKLYLRSPPVPLTGSRQKMSWNVALSVPDDTFTATSI